MQTCLTFSQVCPLYIENTQMAAYCDMHTGTKLHYSVRLMRAALWPLCVVAVVAWRNCFTYSGSQCQLFQWLQDPLDFFNNNLVSCAQLTGIL